MLSVAVPFLEREIHPTVIIAAFNRALEDALKVMDQIATKVNVNDRKEMLEVVRSSLGTKLVSRWSDLMCNLALDAVMTVATEAEGVKEVDIKRYARVEKVRAHAALAASAVAAHRWSARVCA